MLHCSKCFTYFIRTLHVFYLAIVYVANVYFKCFSCFRRIMELYIASVLGFKCILIAGHVDSFSACTHQTEQVQAILVRAREKEQAGLLNVGILLYALGASSADKFIHSVCLFDY